MNYKNYFKQRLIEAMISPEEMTDVQSFDPSLSQQTPPQTPPTSPKQAPPDFDGTWPEQVGYPPSQSPPNRGSYPPGPDGDREYRKALKYWEDQWRSFLRRFGEFLRRNPARGFGRHTIPEDLPFNFPNWGPLNKPFEKILEQYQEWFLASMTLGTDGAEQFNQEIGGLRESKIGSLAKLVGKNLSYRKDKSKDISTGLGLSRNRLVKNNVPNSTNTPDDIEGAKRYEARVRRTQAEKGINKSGIVRG